METWTPSCPPLYSAEILVVCQVRNLSFWLQSVVQQLILAGENYGKHVCMVRGEGTAWDEEAQFQVVFFPTCQLWDLGQVMESR